MAPENPLEPVRWRPRTRYNPIEPVMWRPRTRSGHRKVMKVPLNDTRVKVPNNCKPTPATNLDSIESKHDDLSSKPSGRDRPENRGNRSYLLKCRKKLTISTMNVRTIRETRKRLEITSCI